MENEKIRIFAKIMNDKYSKYDLKTGLGEYEDKQTALAISRISDGQVVGIATEDGMFQWGNGSGQLNDKMLASACLTITSDYSYYANAVFNGTNDYEVLAQLL